MPILWAARLLGSPLPAKVSGSDLVMPLMRRAERMGWRVYILGGGPGVGEKAAERLVSQLPRLIVVGTDAPQVDMRAARATRAPAIERVRAVNPDLVLVALGAPKQELLIAEFSEELRPAVLLGIGASVDFIAGTAQRAPRWMSDAGLEWLYRMAREPRRLWKRYLLRDPEFALVLVREFLRARGKSG
jgi:N-acetylglucosaminyldiphosphoundecaprenol N-acetyl-beta-D-mannosaminyltransferase